MGSSGRAHASGHAGQAERCAHHFEETATRDGVDPFRCAFGEFAVQRFLEIVASRELFEAAPVFGAGLLGGIVRRRLIDARADGIQVQFAFLAGANIFALFILLFHFHCRPRATILSPLRGLFQILLSFPRLTPWAAILRRYAADWLRRWLARASRPTSSELRGRHAWPLRA